MGNNTLRWIFTVVGIWSFLCGLGWLLRYQSEPEPLTIGFSFVVAAIMLVGFAITNQRR